MTASEAPAFFVQALQAAPNKQTVNHDKTPEQTDAAIRQLVSKVIVTEGQVIDVFTAAGLPGPDISILSDQVLAEVRGHKHKNVAAAELIAQVKKSVTIDWILRKSARARIKVMVERILNKHGYPRDLQGAALQTVSRRRSCCAPSGFDEHHRAPHLAWPQKCAVAPSASRRIMLYEYNHITLTPGIKR
jgi:hypothetical protein